MKNLLSSSLVALALMAGVAASAPILSLQGGTADSLDATYDPEDGATGAANGDAITVADSFLEGLLLDGPASVTFTYLGEEASFNNHFHLVAGNVHLFDNTDTYLDTSGVLAMLPDGNGFLPFKFISAGIGALSVTNGAVAGGLGALSTIGFKLLNQSLNSASYLALFNDIGGGDSDYDDTVIRIDAVRSGELNEVPLPAGLALLLTGLTGVGFLGRFRKKTT